MFPTGFVHSLPIFVRLAGRQVILVGEGEAAAAKRRLLERAGAVVVGEDGASSSRSLRAQSRSAEGALATRFSTSLETNGGEVAVLAIVVDDEAAVVRLKARGVLVNAVDRAELCDFTLPAIVDRDPVLVAVGTGGASAGLAAALRQRLEGILPAGLGGLAEALHAARDMLREHYPDSTERRRMISEMLSEGGDLDPLVSREEICVPAKAGIQSVLPPSREPIALERLALASPDPDDLTLRQARALANADRVTHRANVPAAILNRARADAVRIETVAAPVDAAPGLTVDVEML